MRNLDLRNIHEGQTVKNYKEMCKLLDQADYTNNSEGKKQQLEKWLEFIDYSRSGRSFYIKEIKTDQQIIDLHKPNEPQEKKYMGQPLKYGEEIATILASVLTKPGYQTFEYYELYELLGMMNKHYRLRDCKTANDMLLHEDEAIAEQQCGFMRSEIHLRLIKLLQSSLSGLHNREWINWKKTMKVWYDNSGRYYYNDKIETRIVGIEHLHRYKAAKSQQPQFGWKNGYTESIQPNYKGLQKDIREQLRIREYKRVWRIVPLPDLQKQQGSEQEVIDARIRLNHKIQQFLFRSFQTGIQNGTLFNRRNNQQIEDLQTPEFIEHIPDLIHFFTDLGETSKHAN